MVKKAASSAKVNRTSAKKPATRKRRVSKSTKVDYYPNRMTVAVSALAGTVLLGYRCTARITAGSSISFGYT